MVAEVAGVTGAWGCMNASWGEGVVVDDEGVAIAAWTRVVVRRGGDVGRGARRGSGRAGERVIRGGRVGGETRVHRGESE